jgi:hypothetical protein
MLVIKPCCAPFGCAGSFCELEHCRAAVFALFPQAQSGPVDVAVDDTDSHYIWITRKLSEQEPPFAFDSGVLMLGLHLDILAQISAIGETEGL